MFLSAVIILICSSVPDKITNNVPLCDETHHIRMMTAEGIKKGIPETESYTDLQMCFAAWEIAAEMDGSSTLGKGEYVR